MKQPVVVGAPAGGVATGVVVVVGVGVLETGMFGLVETGAAEAPALTAIPISPSVVPD